MENKKLKELFVSYKLAIIVRDLGFNELCFNQYTDGTLDLPCTKYDYPKSVESIPAPVYDQIVRWLREKYFIDVSIKFICSTNEIIDIYGVINFMINEFNEPDIIIESENLDFYSTLDITLMEIFNKLNQTKSTKSTKKP